MNSFAKAMSKLGVSGKLVVADITEASPAFQIADVGCLVPHAESTEYIPSLLEIVKQHEVGLVIPLTDLDIGALASTQNEFADLGCTVMVGSEHSIATCRDKVQTNDFLHRIGLESIRTLTLHDFMVQPFYPCFIKPIRGSASIGTSVLNNEHELHTHAAAFGDEMIVQEYVDGQEYTVDIYRDRSGKTRSVVPRQRLVVRSGEVEQALTVKDEQLIEAATHLSDMLDGMWGVFCCQCRREKDQPPRFFEINPRFGGGVPLSIAAGADLPAYLLQEVLGMDITAKLGDFIDHMLMMRYEDAIFSQVDSPEDINGFDHPIFR